MVIVVVSDLVVFLLSLSSVLNTCGAKMHCMTDETNFEMLQPMCRHQTFFNLPSKEWKCSTVCWQPRVKKTLHLCSLLLACADWKS